MYLNLNLNLNAMCQISFQARPFQTITTRRLPSPLLPPPVRPLPTLSPRSNPASNPPAWRPNWRRVRVTSAHIWVLHRRPRKKRRMRWPHSSRLMAMCRLSWQNGTAKTSPNHFFPVVKFILFFRVEEIRESGVLAGPATPSAGMSPASSSQYLNTPSSYRKVKWLHTFDHNVFANPLIFDD